MSFKVGETGKTLRVAAGFDMTSYTELTLDFTLPDATTAQKATANGVALGTGAVIDPDLGSLNANEYVEYPVETGFLSQSGDWSVRLTYTNTTPTPDHVYIGTCATFTVSDPTCS